MSDVPGQATYPFVEMRDKVLPNLPDDSGKEHLSIVICGHDVGGGRSTMEGQKETFQGMMEKDGEQTQCAVAKSRANSTSDKEVDLWMEVCEQGYPSILRLHHYFLETQPMIAMELVDPIIACTAMACTAKEAVTEMVHCIFIDAPGHRDLIRAQIDDILKPCDAAVRRPYADIPHYTIADALGHRDFIMNTITDASQATRTVTTRLLEEEDETENGYLNDTQENKVTMYSETDGARYALEFEYTLFVVTFVRYVLKTTSIFKAVRYVLKTTSILKTVEMLSKFVRLDSEILF